MSNEKEVFVHATLTDAGVTINMFGNASELMILSKVIERAIDKKLDRLTETNIEVK